ncbi:hypothetical protein F5X98DRAFT_387170 [Xylaria grammica]|nr:hypothetical protein F5X98DRAFT_387170 [Xylaria grammica]
MENRRRAQSVLEFLTAKNPPITRVGGSSGQNGSRLDYYCPAAVKHWDEFNYEVLETIFGGELMREAKKERSNLPHYPHLDEDVDLRLGKSEPITRSLFNKWNHTIVLASLRAVQDAFHPCLWRETTGEKPSKSCIPLPTDSENSKRAPDEATPEPEGMNRAEKTQKAIRKERSKRSRQPDGGSVSVREILLKKSGERFPKEYKPASNWSSKKLRDGKYTNKETGEWHKEVQLIINNNIAPIRQAYTYCIDYGCRYGCILTTSEAFIFRIKPRGNYEGSIDDDPSSFSQLIEKVKADGLMEFVSIPWMHGCDDHHHDYKEFTVNLALWFTHILAGNHYKLDWKYPNLHEEELVRVPQQQGLQPRVSDKGAGKNSREVSLSQPQTAKNKRKRHEPIQQETSEEYTQSKGQQENQDMAHFSFTKTPLPKPTVHADHYAAGTQYSSDVGSDKESHEPPIKRRLRPTSRRSESRLVVSHHHCGTTADKTSSDEGIAAGKGYVSSFPAPGLRQMVRHITGHNEKGESVFLSSNHGDHHRIMGEQQAVANILYSTQETPVELNDDVDIEKARGVSIFVHHYHWYSLPNIVKLVLVE